LQANKNLRLSINPGIKKKLSMPARLFGMPYGLEEKFLKELASRTNVLK